MFKRQLHLFVLLFAFAFAQFGLFTHEVSHYADVSKVAAEHNHQQNKPEQDLNKTHCVTCLAYSGIGTANTTTPLVFAFYSAEQHYSALNNTTHFSFYFSNTHARAPPVLA